MEYNYEQVLDIIKTRPNKDKIERAKKQRKKLMLHVYGTKLQDNIQQVDGFETSEKFAIRKKYALSNKDIFERILGDEDQVFTTRGGSTTYGMDAELTTKMNRDIFG